VKGVPRFVEEGAEIASEAGCVHEDERSALDGEGGLISTGSFSDSCIEIERGAIAQGAEEPAEFIIDVIEDFLRAFHHAIDIAVKRVEWRAVFHIDAHIPRTVRIYAERFSPRSTDCAIYRNDDFGDGVVVSLTG